MDDNNASNHMNIMLVAQSKHKWSQIQDDIFAHRKDIVYLLAVGEGFGAGRVTVPHSGWPVLWKAAPFQQETTEVIIAISLLIAR